MSDKIIYTITDEAPMLATYSLLPVIQRFAKPAGIKVETSDISVAARIITQFNDRLKPEQQVLHALSKSMTIGPTHSEMLQLQDGEKSRFRQQSCCSPATPFRGRAPLLKHSQKTVAPQVPDNLADLGKLCKTPGANIIKLPNVSASIPQLNEAIAELQSKGYNIPNYPQVPKTPEEEEIKARYAKVAISVPSPCRIA